MAQTFLCRALTRYALNYESEAQEDIAVLKRLDSHLAEVGIVNFPGRPASSDKSWFQGALRVKIGFANLVLLAPSGFWPSTLNPRRQPGNPLIKREDIKNW